VHAEVDPGGRSAKNRNGARNEENAAESTPGCAVKNIAVFLLIL
jgi:hypothetical protein